MSVVAITPDRVLLIANSFPATQQILMQLGTLLQNPLVSLERIVVPLKRDPALTARLIRTANSVAYAQADPVASVEEAATRIGFREVHRLVGLAIISQFGEDGLPSYGISGRLFLENSLFAALLMEELAAGANEDPPYCYTVGLLRSIGKITLNRVALEFPPGEIPQRGEDASLSEWEKSVFGITSNEVAAEILKAWRFPHELVAAIGDHYCPGGRHMPLTHLLHLASGMADRLGHGLPGESSYWLDSDDIFRKAGLDPKTANPIIDHALNSFERLQQTFR